MADGNTHDRIGLYCLAPVVAGSLITTRSPELSAAIASGYAIGICWLSPDLDCKSNPYRRWGLLRWVWYPYRKLMKHRGLSHWIIFGTLSRLLYLSIPLIAIVLTLVKTTPNINWLQIAAIAYDACFKYGLLAIAFVGGLELSAWVHLFLDGILLPFGGDRKHKTSTPKKKNKMRTLFTVYFAGIISGVVATIVFALVAIAGGDAQIRSERHNQLYNQSTQNNVQQVP